jgi:hypothetical protein
MKEGNLVFQLNKQIVIAILLNRRGHLWILNIMLIKERN